MLTLQAMQQFPGGFAPPAQYPIGQPYGASTSAAPQPDPAAQALRVFWDAQAEEVQQVGTDIQEFKNHQLPLARIKKAGGCAEGVCLLYPHCLAQPVQVAAGASRLKGKPVRRRCARGTPRTLCCCWQPSGDWCFVQPKGGKDSPALTALLWRSV
jgi:hypothetical protein